MSVALFSAGVANPRKKNKQKVWTLWFVVRVHTRAFDSRDEWRPEEGEASLVGSKEPCGMRRKKRPFRRGKRSRRGGARHVRRRKHPVRPLPTEKASRRERGSVPRKAHFVSAFERSAARLVKTSQQCLDIKRKGKERGLRVLPPRAALGLARRQTSIRHACAFWGDAYAKVHGVSRLTGRQCWRDLLRRLSEVRLDDDVSFYDGASTIASDEASEEPNPIGPDGIENRSADNIIAMWESTGFSPFRRRGPALCSVCGRPCFSRTGRHGSCRRPRGNRS